ncbi:dirigent protein 22-like [Tripterygium wilfordii]|uniref:Dirigent protein n=1 Tax=Tripterygium wilfordii TaxID=458696 RepID=A0A7J7CNS5_TRIWF|nr:dirigent protein 22-like [Tripterygium wilfordii]
MAGLLSIILAFSFTLFHLFTNLEAKSINKDNHEFARSLDPKILNLKKEKLTQMTLYWHDLAEGQNQTSIVSVPPPTNTSATLFGQIRVMDNPLTAKPYRRSKVIGRSQGLYAPKPNINCIRATTHQHIRHTLRRN